MAPRRAAVIAGLAFCTLLAACGAPSAQVPGSPSIPPAPSADPFTSAITMTRTWAASELEAVSFSTVAGVSRQRHGRGEVAIDKGYADIAWVTDGVESRELVNDRAIFTQDGAPDDGWTRTESDGSTPTSAFADPLRLLTEVGSVSREGEDSMDGFEAIRYRGSLPVTAANLAGLGLTDDEVARIVAAAQPDDEVIVTAWEDPNHRLVRIDRSIDLASGSQVQAHALASIHLWDFGIVTAPRP